MFYWVCDACWNFCPCTVICNLSIYDLANALKDSIVWQVTLVKRFIIFEGQWKGLIISGDVRETSYEENMELKSAPSFVVWRKSNFWFQTSGFPFSMTGFTALGVFCLCWKKEVLKCNRIIGLKLSGNMCPCRAQENWSQRICQADDYWLEIANFISVVVIIVKNLLVSWVSKNWVICDFTCFTERSA